MRWHWQVAGRSVAAAELCLVGSWAMSNWFFSICQPPHSFSTLLTAPGGWPAQTDSPWPPSASFCSVWLWEVQAGAWKAGRERGQSVSSLLYLHSVLVPWQWLCPARATAPVRLLLLHGPSSHWVLGTLFLPLPFQEQTLGGNSFLLLLVSRCLIIHCGFLTSCQTSYIVPSS